MSAPAATQTMSDLLKAVLSDQGKTAAENAEPGTSSGLSGKPDGEATYTEGERSAENDAFIRDELGSNGAEGAPPPDASVSKLDQAHRAAKIAPTGEDPESESSSQSPPSEAEPGTSAPGLSLGEKVGNWTKNATDLLIEFSADLKASEKVAKQQPAAESDKQSGDDSDQTAQYDDPYMAFANGDEKVAQEAYSYVMGQLIDGQLAGEKLASMTIEYLESLQKSADQTKQASVKIEDDLRKKLAMGEGMPPAPPEAGGEMGAPPMPPMEGGGGGDAGMAGEDPAMIEQAIVELASELGVSPEELVMMLESEAGVGGEPPMEGGGGEPASSGPPAPPSEPPAPSDGGGESGGESGGDSGGGEDSKESRQRQINANLKVAADINRIKKHATDILREKLRQGQR